MSKADGALKKPTAEIRATMKALQEASASSQSEARRDFEYDDGSVLVVTSREGVEAKLEVVEPA